jgi:hypothetical protein
MSVLTGSRHLSDEDLLRYMDHQLDHEGTRLMGAHLRTCDDCSVRLEGWKHKAAAVHAALGALPEQAPEPNRRAVALAALDRTRVRAATRPAGLGWLKAAAAVLLALGLGLVSEPGRALVAEGIVRAAGREPGTAAARLVEWLGQEQRLASAPAPEAAAAAPLATNVASDIPSAPQPAAPLRAEARAPARPRIKPGMSAPLRFTPDGPDVTLSFATVQSAGTATLWIRDVPHANVQAVSNYHGETLDPTPGGLEVANQASSRADYVITVPTRYRFIRVHVGDTPEVLIRITKSKQDWIWTINLQNSALQ